MTMAPSGKGPEKKPKKKPNKNPPDGVTGRAWVV